jgi:hypothetical protein
MLEPELKHYLEQIVSKLQAIQYKKEGLWRVFGRGVMHGLGSVIGVAIALIIIGWILNTIGVIPAFREQARSWQQTLEEIKRTR